MKLLVVSGKVKGKEKGTTFEIEGNEIPAKYLNLVQVVQIPLSKPKLEGSTPKSK